MKPGTDISRPFFSERRISDSLSLQGFALPLEQTPSANASSHKNEGRLSMEPEKVSSSQLIFSGLRISSRTLPNVSVKAVSLAVRIPLFERMSPTLPLS